MGIGKEKRGGNFKREYGTLGPGFYGPAEIKAKALNVDVIVAPLVQQALPKVATYRLGS